MCMIDHCINSINWNIDIKNFPKLDKTENN